MQIRAARAEDFGEVMRLYRQLQPEDPVLEDGRDQTVFETILLNDWLTILLLEQEQRVCASCYLNLVPNLTRSARPYAVIENVITDKALRGRGLGKTLMAEALNIAWGQGCYKAMLQTGSKQASTHAFYRSCGFSGDEKKGYVARPAYD